MATATAELKNAQAATALATADLLLLLGESDLPVAEVAAKVSEPVLARAWAAGEIEFGHSKYILTNAPGGDPPNTPQKVGATLVVEGGVEWSGPKQRYHGRVKDVLAGAVMPAASYYQRYQQEVCVNKATDVWQWVEKDTDVAGREVRWVRRDCSKAEAEKLFGWFVKLTDKGLSQLQAE